jgi:hypothetical protein
VSAVRPISYIRRAVDDELDELVRSLPAISLEGAKAVGKTATWPRDSRDCGGSLVARFARSSTDTSTASPSAIFPSLPSRSGTQRR